MQYKDPRLTMTHIEYEKHNELQYALLKNVLKIYSDIIYNDTA